MNYDTAPVTQSEVLLPETTEAVPGNQYSFTSSAPGYSYENGQDLNVAFSDTHTSSQVQSLAPFSSVLVNGELVFPSLEDECFSSHSLSRS